MNKKELIKQISDQKSEVEKLVKTIDSSRILSFEGSVYFKKQHDGLRCYIKDSDGGILRYQKDENSRDVRQLCNKVHGKRLRAAAQKEIVQLGKCLEILESDTDAKGADKADIDAVYGNLPEGIKKHTNPSMFTDDGYAEKWQKAEYQNRWMKSDFSIETPRGERVRSKSEWMIASMLAEAGVPYRYEEIIALNPYVGVFLYPDFTVMNKRTRKVYYWEHFGRMDDPEYINNSYIPKINDYYNFEFMPGEKLLMTFESGKRPFDTTQVKRIIEHFLI
ncbi:MAG: hypothetical protein IKR80_02365 [Spirochaetales bacterium]|nr:hypothetical protein [Spirochaetales bacterium]